MKQTSVAGSTLAALAIGLCCGVPTLLASGTLGVIAGALARVWPLVLAGTLVLGYAVARLVRRARVARKPSERSRPMDWLS